MADDQQQQQQDDFKYIVRIANTDLDGNDRVEVALADVKGLGVRLGGIIARRAGVPRYQKIGDLSDEDVQKLEAEVEAIQGNVPTWMLNRANDVETGDALHYIGAELELKKRDDLNRLKKIQSYRGIRHATNQKVRGQRSRSNGRTGLAVGVVKKKD